MVNALAASIAFCSSGVPFDVFSSVAPAGSVATGRNEPAFAFGSSWLMMVGTSMYRWSSLRRPSSSNVSTLAPLTPIARPVAGLPIMGPSFLPVMTHSSATVLPFVYERVIASLKSGYVANVCLASAVMASLPENSGSPGMTSLPVGS